MTDKPDPHFGRRRQAAPPRPAPPSKRSNHVALLVMGTLAVGGGAYALMPRENCQPNQPGVTAPAQPGADCAQRSSSSSSGGHGGSGGSSSRSSFYGGDSSGGASSSSSSSVSRGGFGSFAHAFGFGGG